MIFDTAPPSGCCATRTAADTRRRAVGSRARPHHHDADLHGASPRRGDQSRPGSPRPAADPGGLASGAARTRLPAGGAGRAVRLGEDRRGHDAAEGPRWPGDGHCSQNGAGADARVGASPAAVSDRAPTSTAAIAASNNDASVCRTPRGSGPHQVLRQAAAPAAGQCRPVADGQILKPLQGSTDRG
jgi:hypothetical protein